MGFLQVFTFQDTNIAATSVWNKSLFLLLSEQECLLWLFLLLSYMSIKDNLYHVLKSTCCLHVPAKTPHSRGKQKMNLITALTLNSRLHISVGLNNGWKALSCSVLHSLEIITLSPLTSNITLVSCKWQKEHKQTGPPLCCCHKNQSNSVFSPVFFICSAITDKLPFILSKASSTPCAYYPLFCIQNFIPSAKSFLKALVYPKSSSIF